MLKMWVFDAKSRSTLFDTHLDYSYPLARRFVIEFNATSNLSSATERENNTE